MPARGMKSTTTLTTVRKSIMKTITTMRLRTKERSLQPQKEGPPRKVSMKRKDTTRRHITRR